jgi:ssDNA-binding Zn-finger/Zn-ribbon topoisomerase 1
MEEDYEPEDPDESDVCPHGHGFDTYCSYCDEEEDEADEIIAVCPECGSDDLELIDENDDGNEYLCNDCGERFTEGEEDDE